MTAATNPFWGSSKVAENTLPDQLSSRVLSQDKLSEVKSTFAAKSCDPADAVVLKRYSSTVSPSDLAKAIF